jgi:uncharacterized membrane protein
MNNSFTIVSSAKENFTTLPTGALGDMLNNALSSFKTWGGVIIMIFGVVMLVMAAYKIFQKFNNAQAPDSWVKLALMILVGAAFLIGGLSVLEGFGQSGQDTLNEFNGAITPFIFMR